jgi:hypothetical protein
MLRRETCAGNDCFDAHLHILYTIRISTIAVGCCPSNAAISQVRWMPRDLEEHSDLDAENQY